jgi:hypothetical protein
MVKSPEAFDGTAGLRCEDIGNISTNKWDQN